MIAGLITAPEDPSELAELLDEHLRGWLDSVLNSSEPDLWDAVGDDLTLRIDEDGPVREDELPAPEREAWRSIVDAGICRCSPCAVARQREDR